MDVICLRLANKDRQFGPSVYLFAVASLVGISIAFGVAQELRSISVIDYGDVCEAVRALLMP